jgi:hypothetical protein
VVKAQAKITIQRPAEVVYRFIAEEFERNYPRWSPEVKELRLLTNGPLKVGSRARQVRVDQGRRTESTFRITRMQSPRPPAAGQLRFEGSSPQFVIEYLIDPEADVTCLTFTFELRRVELMMKPFEKLIRIAVQDGARRTVFNLKQLIETEQARATA